MVRPLFFRPERFLILCSGCCFAFSLQCFFCICNCAGFVFLGWNCWTPSAGTSAQNPMLRVAVSKSKRRQMPFYQAFHTNTVAIPLSFLSPLSPDFYSPRSLVRCFCRPTRLLDVIACHRILHSKPVDGVM